MKKGEQKNAKNCEESNFGFRTVILSSLVTIVTIMVMLCLVFFGMEMGSKGNSFKGFFISDTAVLNVSFDAYSYDYTLDSTQRNKDTKLSYAFNDLDVKNVSGNYAIINSETQYNSFVMSFARLTGEEIELEAESGFFETGSVIAIAMETQEYKDFSDNISITRDDKYNLTATITATRKEDTEYDDNSDISAKLYLVKIENIQPEKIEIIYNK